MNDLKTIFIVRHAHAEDFLFNNKTDFDRHLTARGRTESVQVANRFIEKFSTPDLIISSSAVRTFETANILSEYLNFDKSKIRFFDSLYLCDILEFEKQISGIDDNSVQTIMIIAHNDGVTNFVNTKIDSFTIDVMPTASIVGFNIKTSEWSKNNPEMKGVFLYFDKPSI